MLWSECRMPEYGLCRFLSYYRIGFLWSCHCVMLSGRIHIYIQSELHNCAKYPPQRATAQEKLSDDDGKKNVAQHTIQLERPRKMRPRLERGSFVCGLFWDHLCKIHIYLCRVPLSHPIHIYLFFCYFFFLGLVRFRLEQNSGHCAIFLLCNFSRMFSLRFQKFLLKKDCRTFAVTITMRHIKKHSIDMALQWTTTKYFPWCWCVHSSNNW